MNLKIQQYPGYWQLRRKHRMDTEQKTAQTSLRLCTVSIYPMVYGMLASNMASICIIIPLLPPARLLPSRTHT